MPTNYVRKGVREEQTKTYIAYTVLTKFASGGRVEWVMASSVGAKQYRRLAAKSLCRSTKSGFQHFSVPYTKNVSFLARVQHCPRRRRRRRHCRRHRGKSRTLFGESCAARE